MSPCTTRSRPTRMATKWAASHGFVCWGCRLVVVHAALPGHAWFCIYMFCFVVFFYMALSCSGGQCYAQTFVSVPGVASRRYLNLFRVPTVDQEGFRVGR